MMDLVWVAILIIDCLTIRDIMEKLQSKTAILLWSIGVVALPPVVIPLWWYTTYGKAAERRLERRERGK